MKVRTELLAPNHDGTPSDLQPGRPAWNPSPSRECAPAQACCQRVRFLVMMSPLLSFRIIWQGWPLQDWLPQEPPQERSPGVLPRDSIRGYSPLFESALE